jgi:hypothetical protein
VTLTGAVSLFLVKPHLLLEEERTCFRCKALLDERSASRLDTLLCLLRVQ